MIGNVRAVRGRGALVLEFFDTTTRRRGSARARAPDGNRPNTREHRARAARPGGRALRVRANGDPGKGASLCWGEDEQWSDRHLQKQGERCGTCEDTVRRDSRPGNSGNHWEQPGFGCFFMRKS